DAPPGDDAPPADDAPAADAAPPAAPASKTPPAGILKRKSDGQMFWQPNPAPATWGGTAPPAAPDDWVKGFLAFYGLASAPGGADGCVFNSAPATLDQVVSTVNSQAALAEYGPSTGAKSIAQKIIADAKADKDAQDGADSVNQTIKKKGDLKAEVGKLAKMDMRALL